MYIEYLVEDLSGAELVREVMKKYALEEPSISIDYTIHSYRGIGCLPKRKVTSNGKYDQLLNDLPKRMKAIQSYFLGKGITDAVLIVLIDNDKRKTDELYFELNNLAKRQKLQIDYVFCVAIEEMEAWLLGDFKAIQNAFPAEKDRILSKHSNYKQDSICGTWEFLADLVFKGGINDFRKRYPTPNDIGRWKVECAKKIGQHLNIRMNNSPSFNRYIGELDKRRKLYLI